MSDKIKEIEDLSELQFSIEEIAIIVGLDAVELKKCINEKKGDKYLAFEKGRLRADASVRASILKLAKQGSTPAQKQMMDLIEKNKERLIKENTRHLREKGKR